MIKKLRIGAGIAVFAFVAIYSILAYFTGSVSPGGALTDGLGRPLNPSPLFVRAVLGQERLWAGFLWFIVDLVVFWGGVALVYLFLSGTETDEDTA